MLSMSFFAIAMFSLRPINNSPFGCSSTGNGHRPLFAPQICCRTTFVRSSLSIDPRRISKDKVQCRVCAAPAFLMSPGKTFWTTRRPLPWRINKFSSGMTSIRTGPVGILLSLQLILAIGLRGRSVEIASIVRRGILLGNADDSRFDRVPIEGNRPTNFIVRLLGGDLDGLHDRHCFLNRRGLGVLRIEDLRCRLAVTHFGIEGHHRATPFAQQ